MPSIEQIEFKAGIYNLAGELVRDSLKRTGNKADFESILTLAAWLMQDEAAPAAEKLQFGFHGGSYAEMDFPEGPVDPLGLSDDEDDYEDDE